MFEGFNESTTGYYQAVRKDNYKRTHQENAVLYLDGVKYPFERRMRRNGIAGSYRCFYNMVMKYE